MNKKSIICIICCIVVVVGIVTACAIKLNFGLEYSEHTEIDIYIGKQFDSNEIKSIAKEELQGLDNTLYEYYISAFGTSNEWNKLSNEDRWDILDEKVDEFFHNFTDNKLKEMYANISFTEEENKYIQLKNMMI